MCIKIFLTSEISSSSALQRKFTFDCILRNVISYTHRDSKIVILAKLAPRIFMRPLAVDEAFPID